MFAVSWRPPQRVVRSDAGFSLIEVIVSLILLGIVATAALYFFIQGTRTTSSLQRSQNAVAIANEAMERAYAISPQDNIITSVGGLVEGRAKTDVEAAWTQLAALGVSGVDDTYPLWDDNVTNSDAAIIKLSYSTEHSGQEYTVQTLVGSCFRSSNVVSTDQVCGKLSGVPADPGAAGTPAGMVRMLRITAVVTWEPLAEECGGTTCLYQLSGLVDRSNDLEWNQIIEPVAVDDFETFTYNEQRAINVLANDLIGPVTSNPVSIFGAPAAGQGTIVGIASNGVVTYKAPANASGLFQFTYRIKDARGTLSLPGTVEVTLPPEVTNDTARLLSGQSSPIPVLANDRGSASAASIAVVSPPSRGSVIISGLNLSYEPAAGVTSGGDSFSYTYTDASGQVSLPAQVTVLIDHIDVQDRYVELPMRASAADVWHDLSALLIGGNSDPSTLTINVSGAPPAATIGALRVGPSGYNGTPASGASVRFNPAQNRIGDYSFGYSLTNGSGLTSPTKTVTVRIVGTPTIPPVARADDFTSSRYPDNHTASIPIGQNDEPTSFTTANGVWPEVRSLTNGCGNFTPAWGQDRLANGEVKIDLPDITNRQSPRSCSFEYTLVDGGGNRSATVTVKFRFENR